MRESISTDDIGDLDYEIEDVAREFKLEASSIGGAPKRIEGSIKEEARETTKKVKESMDGIGKQVSAIQRITELLRVKDRDDPVTPSVMPDPREVEYDQDYTECILAALEIVTKYQNVEVIDMHEAHKDASTLQAYLVSIATHMAFAQSRYAHMDRSLDVIRAKHFMRAKTVAQENRIKLTDVEAKEYAKAASAAHVGDIGAAETYWRYIYNVYMAILSFVEVLDHSASREYKINFEQSRQR
jgi:hypothetical protein